ncbi:hypothetical protein LCGC14_3037540, partial [marine sediment metagenome]
AQHYCTEAELLARMHHRAPVVVAGREWSILCTPSPGFLRARSSWYPWAIFFGGLQLTALLASYLVKAGRASAWERKHTAELREAHEELTRSHGFLQTVIDALPEPTMVLNLDHTIALANRAARDLTGGDDPAACGMTCHWLFHHRDTPCFGKLHICPVEEVRATKKPVVLTHPYHGADGARRILEMAAAPVTDEAGAVVQIINSCHDVTARKQAEEALRASETEKMAILDAMPDHVLFQNTDMTIRWGNEAAARSVGRTRQELLGACCYELWHGRTEPCDPCPVRTALETGLPAADTVRLHDGTWCEIMAHPVQDRDGRLLGAIEITRDVTARRHAEEEIRGLAKFPAENPDPVLRVA